MQFPKAHDGVKKLFIAEILEIVAALLAVVGAIMAAVIAANPDNVTGLSTLGVLAASGILMIIAFVFQVIGLIQAGKEEHNFKVAFWIVLLSILFTILNVVFQSFLPDIAALTQVFGTLSDLSVVIITIFILFGISNLATQLGDQEMADKGKSLANLIAIMYVVSILLGLVPSFFKNPSYGASVAFTVLACVAAFIELCVYIATFIYLGKAVKMLKK